MNVAVFGANGRTGREVVRCAVEQQHHVTAIVRQPGAMTEQGQGFAVALADVHDQAAVDEAVSGADAIISTLGGRPRQPTTVYSHGIDVIATALRKAGARRLICLSSGALNLGPHVPAGQRIVSRAVVRLVFRDGHADMAKMEAVLSDTPDLDWTVVRVPGLTNKPAASDYRVSEPPLDRPSTIPRADLAAYLVSILADTSTHQKIIEISR